MSIFACARDVLWLEIFADDLEKIKTATDVAETDYQSEQGRNSCAFCRCSKQWSIGASKAYRLGARIGV